MTGFYGEMGWLHQRQVKPPGGTILGCSGGSGQFGTVSKPSICWGIGVNGVGGRDINGVGCWLNGG